MSNPATESTEPTSRRAGGCCGCLFFPTVVGLFGGAIFWFFGFAIGLAFHAVASLAWAATYAIGHALFGWPLPALKPQESPIKRLRE